MIRDDSSDSFDQPAANTIHCAGSKRGTNHLVEIPFMQRPTCTIREACKASGMGRTKFYELIKSGEFKTISIGRRRLVQVPSLLKFLGVDDQSS